jgi:DivIVA domain-containing protein
VSFLLLLAVLAVIAGVVLVVAGRVSPGLPPAEPDRAPTGVLPPDEVGPPDVERLRFSLAFRGYRMDEVDDVLDRLTAELTARDARIAELEGRTPEPAGAATASAEEPVADPPAPATREPHPAATVSGATAGSPEPQAGPVRED